MLRGFPNTKLSSNHKSLSHNNLFILVGGGGIYRSIFWKLEPQPPSLLLSGGTPAVINEDH